MNVLDVPFEEILDPSPEHIAYAAYERLKSHYHQPHESNAVFAGIVADTLMRAKTRTIDSDLDAVYELMLAKLEKSLMLARQIGVSDEQVEGWLNDTIWTTCMLLEGHARYWSERCGEEFESLNE